MARHWYHCVIWILLFVLLMRIRILVRFWFDLTIFGSNRNVSPTSHQLAPPPTSFPPSPTTEHWNTGSKFSLYRHLTPTLWCALKVHKHEIILNFFFTKIKSLYALGKFSKKISLSFLRFSPEFRSSHIYAVTEQTRNQIFLRDIPKFFFFKIFTMVLLDGFLDGFSKFWFFIVEICILIRDFWVIFENYCMRMLSILWTDFIACWAY